MLVFVTVISAVHATDASEHMDLFAFAEGQAMTSREMADTDGDLWIFGIEIFPRLRRVERKQKCSDTSAVHCDIISQNRADDLGLNTTGQDGSQADYNNVRVSSIYDSFPDNRHSEPPPGTAGYIFTSYSNGYDKEHMGTYQRSRTSSTYTRYGNDGHVETRYEATSSYTPTDVTAQSFVPLPRYDHTMLYYR